jgi:hypothetical protein
MTQKEEKMKSVATLCTRIELKNAQEKSVSILI